MTTIAVIVPVYNSADTIARTAKSILSQTRLPDEIIIVDDKSTDETLRVLRSLDQRLLTIISKATNGGCAAARNLGIKAAKSEWISFLDADDEWAPEFLETVENLIKSAPEVGFVFTGYDRIEVDGRRTVSKFSSRTHERYKGRLSLKEHAEIWMEDSSPAMCTDTSVCRADLIRKVGFFNENYRRGSDTDMWLRILDQTDAAYSTKVLATYHRSVGSIVSTRGNERLCYSDTILKLAAKAPEPTASILRRLLNTQIYNRARSFLGRQALNPSLTDGFDARLDPRKFLLLKLMTLAPVPLARALKSIGRSLKGAGA